MKNHSYRKITLLMLLVPGILLLGMFLLNFMVDPYQMNRIFDLEMPKKEVSYRANYRLYKLLAYQEHPQENLLFGDSRIDGLDVKKIKAISGDDYYNFAYGGGTAYEIVDTFWYAAHLKKIKKAYIGINFNLYNAANRFNLVKEAELMVESPIKYYLSPFVTKISFYNIIEKFLRIPMVSEKPAMAKEAFWKHQLEDATKGFYGRYEYPHDLYEELRKIKSYCDAQQIELVFIIPPTHVDLQKQVRVYGLEDAYQKYKADLKSIAPVVDFDTENQWTENEALFDDPYHGGAEVKAWVIDGVWRKMIKNMGE